MVKKIVNYVCEICGAVFEDEKMAKKCEEQKVKPFIFDLKEIAILKGAIFPENVEIIGKLRAQEKHENVYKVKKTVGWGESTSEEESIVYEKDLISKKEYDKAISDLFEK